MHYKHNKKSWCKTINSPFQINSIPFLGYPLFQANFLHSLNYIISKSSFPFNKEGQGSHYDCLSWTQKNDQSVTIYIFLTKSNSHKNTYTFLSQESKIATMSAVLLLFWIIKAIPCLIPILSLFDHKNAILFSEINFLWKLKLLFTKNTL